MRADEVRRLVVASDLHLDASPDPARRDGGAAFTRFLASIVLPDDRPGARLLLLGDTFELADASANGDGHAIARMNEIAGAHPRLLATLLECLRRGWRLDIVPGNHDMALTRSAVQRRLIRLLGTAAHRMRIHPWLYHVPGVLYAEHGHQHHDLNRFPTVLAPDDPRRPDRLFVPPLGAWTGKVSARLLRAFVDSRRGEFRVRSPAYRARIAEVEPRLALPRDVVSQLHGLSRFRFRSTAVRLARRALNLPAARQPDGYLIAAAGRIHSVLSEVGRDVPVYAFGHTHHARTVRLADGAWYVNTGTWTADVRGAGPDRDDPDLYPYLDITVGTADIVPAIRYWRRT